ncbi:adenylate/guanylate cyclase domain-containing protein [Nocardioides speluncae]|uniref:adenylate/guanylate cyclase domain-containing protein n=1 Tax=Nocardioides speluncae TaxID=2670337 RepID=UPI000D69D48D|nr:adenylate/guanylate cyclase domain-containing protein [Nocardioides speluncae]
MTDDPPELVSPEEIERLLMGAKPTLTRQQVAAKAGVPMEVATELWHLLGFAHHEDSDVAFTKADVKALAAAAELMGLGLVDPESQAAMVRTWGRSFARLAEWQTDLLADVVAAQPEPARALSGVVGQVLPRIEYLQEYIWRRHLVSAAARLLAVSAEGLPKLAVGFVDIVGYTSISKSLSERELVALIEYFEDEVTRAVVDAGGRVIKTIGDEVLFVADRVRAAADVALDITARGAVADDRFPQVRAGVAYGEVLSRLGDVFGPTVNIASRLTSVARPGTVLVDRGARDSLVGVEPRVEQDDAAPLAAIIDAIDVPGLVGAEEEVGGTADLPGYRLRRMRRTSVKGYSRLEPWVLRRAPDPRLRSAGRPGAE